MRKHFESGLAFIVVAVLSVGAGLLLVANGNGIGGIAFLAVGGLWVIIAIGVRNRSGNTK